MQVNDWKWRGLLQKQSGLRGKSSHHEDHEDHEVKFDDKWSEQVIGCAIDVHRQLGPGLLESTYEQCLAYELQLKNIDFKLQHPLPVKYKGVSINCGYRVDILVENELIVELKSVEEVKAIHEAQLLTYMKLSRTGTGLLINFNVKLLRSGIRRFVL